MRPHGIHAGVPAHEYHQRVLGVASKSALDLVNRSPAHYLEWVRGAEEESSDALFFGSAFHMALLEPEVFAANYAVRPKYDRRTKGGKAASELWDVTHPGVTAISEDMASRIIAMVAAVASHPLAGKMVRDGEPELSAYWQDKETGVECKARADYYVRGRKMLVDVKTTEDARPDHFQRDLAKYGYARQAAMYLEAFQALGEDVQFFCFAVVEKHAPFAVATYVLDANAMARGSYSIRGDLETLAECMKTDTWPAYAIGLQEISLPAWAA